MEKPANLKLKDLFYSRARTRRAKEKNECSKNIKAKVKKQQSEIECGQTCYGCGSKH